MTVVVRPATPADLDAMARLAEDAMVGGWSARAIAESIETPMGQAWVALDDEDVCGFILGRVVADEAELLLVAVASAARRRGVATALCQAFIEQLRSEGVAAVYLEVAEGNAAARALYDGLNFRPNGRREKYYATGEAAVLMRWGGEAG